MKKNIKKDIIMILILLLSFAVVTFSKFVKLDFHSYFLNAKHFYFTSNRLKPDGATYLVNNWSGVGSFNISFDLSSEKNSHVHTDYDIPYEVEFNCPNDVTCSLDKTTGTIYNEGNHSDTVTLSVNPGRNYQENERLSIGITARSTSPYLEEISANFEYVVGKQGITYEIEDEPNRAYIIFKITNAINYCDVIEAFDTYQIGDSIDINVYKNLSSTDKTKCISKNITIGFDPNILLLDTTSNIVDMSTYGTTNISGTDYINSLSFNIEPVSTIAIKFYKVNTVNNYTYPIVNNQSVINVTIN